MLRERSFRDQFEPCAGLLVSPRGFSYSQTIAPMAVLLNAQTPSSSCCSDFQVPLTFYDRRQESWERNCPSFSMARIFLGVTSSFFRHRERSPGSFVSARIVVNFHLQWATCEARAQPVYVTPVSFFLVHRQITNSGIQALLCEMTLPGSCSRRK